MSGVHVVAEGNPRKGAMDVDEREQCIHDIVSWFQRKANLESAAEKNADIEALEKTLGGEIPEELRSLLMTQSGGIWFDDYKSLSADEIINKAEALASIKGWDSSLIPFAANVDGGALVTDTGSRNAVFEFSEDGKGDRPLASSLLEYLEKYRNRLLSGKFDFVEDVGLVERSRK
ncbi:hypothetical protein F441_17439 [Phytophthora nicotianae CJ01A1]|uniref:Knr4/Smi1-like domain-containing protein n=6 Tax=Phytophthora nicotianae TaxID=4792 RepID=W2QYU9_PHYN3|nr:hypothetical protein PPTG_04003 [Phytophthora nicotianae INRA-310]ETI36294.1 hypothetical protein F443_17569 [Phytophthora nicotianae P1569]ETK76514.1 hypothetical protein L915_17103 [Phytophthora nicotianae]ETO65021.1 hypothetical protein F444_17612 [Phytophthora nicotianae P1976]ETP06116.1 hypothetical protein F441_17439 [Phytophthora nicotianae CJ01A1]ETP34240.1 hypothetical protein F442_17425 [Phytophthora nicotianae P10297]